MAYEADKLKKVGVYIEPTGSFAANGSGSVVYRDLGVDDDLAFTTDTEMLANNVMQQDLHRSAKSIPGAKTCTANLTFNLKGTGVPLASGTLHQTKTAEMDLLAAVFGGYFQSTGSVVHTSPNSGSMTLSSSAGTPPGSCIGLVNPSTGLLEVSRVLSRTAQAIVLEHPLSFTPSLGQQVYGCHNFYPSSDPSGSVQLFIQGKNAADKWVLMGMQGTPTFVTTNGQLLKCSLALQGKDYTTGSSATTLFTASLSQGQEVALLKSRLLFYQAPSVSSAPAGRVELASARDFAITVNWTWEAVEGPGGAANTVRWRMVPTQGQKAANFRFITAFDTYEYFAARDNQTVYGAALQVGSSVSGSVYFSLPRTQVLGVDHSPLGNIRGTGVDVAALWNETAETSQTDELSSAPFTLAIFA